MTGDLPAGLWLFAFLFLQVVLCCLPPPPSPRPPTTTQDPATGTATTASFVSTTTTGNAPETGTDTTIKGSTTTGNPTTSTGAVGGTGKYTTNMLVSSGEKFFSCQLDFGLDIGSGITVQSPAISSSCSPASPPTDGVTARKFLDNHEFEITTDKDILLSCSMTVIVEDTETGLRLLESLVLKTTSCEAVPGPCLTESGAVFPAKCAVPFIHNKTIYQACTEWPGSNDTEKLWCATETNADQTAVADKWGWCSSSCGYCGGSPAPDAEGTSTSASNMSTTGTSPSETASTPSVSGLPTTSGPGSTDCEISVIAEASYSSQFAAANVLVESQDSSENGFNYWLAKHNKGEFTLDLGCLKKTTGVRIINTHNSWAKDRATKRFRLVVSTTKEGPFDSLIEESLPDSRQQDPVPVLTFPFPETQVRFVKFQVLEHWGAGGGLQFIQMLTMESRSDLTEELTNSTSSNMRLSSSIKKCGYDCFINPQKVMTSFTLGLSNEDLLPPTPSYEYDSLTVPKWNIIRTGSFQFYQGDVGIYLDCPNSQFSKFKGTKRIFVECIGNYMFSVFSSSVDKLEGQYKNTDFGCDPCPIDYKYIPGYIKSYRISGSHKSNTESIHHKMKSQTHCKDLCEEQPSCTGFQFSLSRQLCSLHSKATVWTEKTVSDYRICKKTKETGMCVNSKAKYLERAYPTHQSTTWWRAYWMTGNGGNDWKLVWSNHYRIPMFSIFKVQTLGTVTLPRTYGWIRTDLPFDDVWGFQPHKTAPPDIGSWTPSTNGHVDMPCEKEYTKQTHGGYDLERGHLLSSSMIRQFFTANPFTGPLAVKVSELQRNLFNIFPQNSVCNKWGKWQTDIETTTEAEAKMCIAGGGQFYLVHGVVPSSETGTSWMGGDINIPDHILVSYCCTNNVLYQRHVLTSNDASCNGLDTRGTPSATRNAVWTKYQAYLNAISRNLDLPFDMTSTYPCVTQFATGYTFTVQIPV